MCENVLKAFSFRGTPSGHCLTIKSWHDGLSLWFNMTTTRTYIDKARKKMLAKKNIELLVLPLKEALEEHVKRADY